MTIIGSAHVVIRAITEKLEADIKQALDKVKGHAGKHGADAGNEWGKSFGISAAAQAAKANVNTTGVFRNIANAAKRWGSTSGDGFMGNFIARARNAGTRLANMGSGIGRTFGGAIRAGFNSSGASRTLISIGLRIAALLPILGALVGAISNLISGLYAFVAALGSAINATIVFGGALAALVQGVVVAIAAFQGVGGAISQGFKAASENTAESTKAMAESARDAAERVRDAQRAVKDAQENSARAIRDAIEGVRDARQNLADTYQNAARAERDAIEAVEDAEENLRRAHENVRDAQERLTDARKEAREELIDLQFASEQSVLSERRAQLALADARYELQKASVLPENNRVRVEAELAYKEAELNLRMIRERQGDIAQEQKKAAKEGVEGSDTVVAAKEQLRDAEDGVRDAVEGVSDALQNQRDVHRDNARAISDAKDALSDAKEQLADAREDGPEAIRDAQEALRDALEAQAELNQEMAAGGKTASEYEKALAKLSPAAQSFVRYVVSLRDEFIALRDAAAEAMFPKLEESLRMLVGGLFPTLMVVMRQTGSAVGDFALSLSKAFTSGPFVKNFADVAKTNAYVIRQFGKATGELSRLIIALLDAAEPLTREFAHWFNTWLRGLRITAEARNENGELTKSFLEAGERAKQVIRIVKNLVEGFYDIGKVAKPQGLILVKAFEEYTERFANFTDKPANVRRLREFFTETRKNFMALSSMIHTLGAAFFRLGESPAIRQIASSMEPMILNLEKMITRLLENSGDEIVAFVDSIIKLFDQLSQSGAFNVFLETITTSLNLFTAALKTPGLGPFLEKMIGFGAALYAISIVRKFPGISFLDRSLRFVGRQTGHAIKQTKLYGKAVGALKKAPGAIFKGIGKGVGAVSKEVIKGGPHIRKYAGTLTGKLSSAVKAARGNLALLWASVSAGLKPLIASGWAWIKTTAAMVAHKVASVAVTAATKAMAAAQWLFNAAMNANPIVKVIGLIFAIGAALVWAYKRFDGFRKVVDKVFKFVVDGAKWLWDVLFGHSIFPDILDAMEAVWKAIGKVIQFAWDRVIKPVFKFMSAFVTNILVPVIKFFWKNIIKPYWTFIGNLIVWVWEKVIKPAFKAIKWYIDNVLIPVIKWLWDKVVKPVFGWIGDKIKNVWNNVIKPVFQAFKSFITDTLVPAFKRGIERIGEWWDKLKGMAAKPVNFVIDTVWNNGLRKLVNKIIDFFGGPKEALKPAGKVNWGNSGGGGTPTYVGSGDRRGYATGGIYPGYTPGRDIGFVGISGGEAVMRPEWTQGVGPDTVHKMNAVARKEGIAGVRKRFSQFLGGFASGGIPAVGSWNQHTSGYPWARWSGDINVPGSGDYGNPVRAYKDGIIAAVQRWTTSYGNHIRINHPDGSQTLYAHLSRIAVAVGQQVARGMVIGNVGSTGNSSGPHLHFEIKNGNGPITEGDGSGAVQSAVDWAREKLGNLVGNARGFVDKIVDKIPGANKGWGQMLARIPGYLLGRVQEWVKGQKLPVDEAHGAIREGLPSTGSVVEIVQEIASRRGWGSGAQWDALRELIMRESSFNPRAQNPTSSAYGLFQFLDSTWAGVGGSKTSDPALQTIYGLRYIANRYGTPMGAIRFHDANNWYDQGGIARGEDAWIPKRTAKPERVLSPRQTEAFERLVEMLDKMNGVAGAEQINLEVNLPQDASARDVVDGIVYELRRSRSVRGGRYRR